MQRACHYSGIDSAWFIFREPQRNVAGMTQRLSRDTQPGICANVGEALEGKYRRVKLQR